MHNTLALSHAVFDKPKYRERYVIECLFGWLKEHRRLAARYCKLATSYADAHIGLLPAVFTTSLFVQFLVTAV